MNRTNYSMEMDKIIASLNGKKASLLLHACCAPCSSAVLERLSKYFNITLLYYNPNIYPPEEYYRRQQELERFIEDAGYSSINMQRLDYTPDDFYSAVSGFENEPEGGKRCTVCYELRMRYAAEYAAEHNFDYFTTTLSISPLKDPVRINEIGKKLEEEYKVKFLTSEFRKRDGYKRSLELSKEYGLYRQNYCGCVFSKTESEKRKNNTSNVEKENNIKF